jgi:hypothetical protein
MIFLVTNQTKNKYAYCALIRFSAEDIVHAVPLAKSNYVIVDKASIHPHDFKYNKQYPLHFLVC